MRVVLASCWGHRKIPSVVWAAAIVCWEDMEGRWQVAKAGNRVMLRGTADR